MDERTGQRYCAMRVSVSLQELRRLGDLRLLPGMQTTGMVKTGERTLMTDLTNPLIRRFQTGLSERRISTAFFSPFVCGRCRERVPVEAGSSVPCASATDLGAG